MQLVGTQFILSDHFMDRCIERGCGKWDTLVSIFKDVYIPYKGNYKVYAGGATFVREYTSDKKTCRYVTIHGVPCGRVVLERTKYFGNTGYYYDSNYFDLIEDKGE